jgi:hypothetical protein
VLFGGWGWEYRSDAGVVGEHETAYTVAVLEVGTSSGQGDLDTCWTPWDERCKSTFSNTEEGFMDLELDGD